MYIFITDGMVHKALSFNSEIHNTRFISAIVDIFIKCKQNVFGWSTEVWNAAENKVTYTSYNLSYYGNNSYKINNV